MFALPTTLTVAFIALALERFLGFPSPLRKLTGHPINWLYRFTGIFAVLVPGAEGSQARKLVMGGAFTVLAVMATLALTLALTSWLRPLGYAWCWEALLAVPFIQQYATRVRARAVAAALVRNDIKAATEAVHMLAPDAVPPGTEAQAVRRTVEAMAKRLVSDIVTPVFWLALFGLPGIVTVAALEAVVRRTADDRSTSALARALMRAARFLPGKLSGILVAGAASLLSPSAGARALEHIHADARFDRVRDANWARAAFAGILKIRLAGPETPGQTRRTDHWIGNGTRDATLTDLRAAMRLLATTLTLLTILAGIAAAFA
jgi:adenosylcobinamide-phosphate synthase